MGAGFGAQGRNNQATTFSSVNDDFFPQPARFLFQNKSILFERTCIPLVPFPQTLRNKRLY